MGRLVRLGRNEAFRSCENNQHLRMFRSCPTDAEYEVSQTRKEECADVLGVSQLGCRRCVSSLDRLTRTSTPSYGFGISFEGECERRHHCQTTLSRVGMFEMPVAT